MSFWMYLTYSLSTIFEHIGDAAAAAAKPLQSCPTLCDPIDGSPPGSPIPGILQARILEWVAISSSNAWKWKVKVKLLSRVQFFMTPWTTAYQAPPCMGFSRQEYWSAVPLPSPIGDEPIRRVRTSRELTERKILPQPRGTDKAGEVAEVLDTSESSPQDLPLVLMCTSASDYVSAQSDACNRHTQQGVRKDAALFSTPNM